MVRRPSFQLGSKLFLCLAKLHGLLGIFTEGVDVPVADETMLIAALQETFPHENIQKHLIAWNILSRAIASNGDRDTFRHASSPATGWRALVDTYSASTLGANVQCLQSLTSRFVKPGTNPIPVFVAIIEDVRNMRATGSDVEDEVACLFFLRALPDEYNVFRQMLGRERKKLTIDRLRTELRAQYDLLKEGKSSKTSDTSFLASGTKRGKSGRRREKCGNVSGNKKRMGGATRKDSNGQGSSSGAGGSNGAPSGKQGGAARCNICKETGHKWFKCPKRICSVYRETGHDPNSCPQVVKEDANFAISDGDRLSTRDEVDGMMCEYLPSQYVLDAFFSVSGGKLFDPDSGIREGIGCEVGELESWISDDGESRLMTSSHDLMTNCRECSGIFRTAGRDVLPIEDVGDILLRFPSDSGAFDIQLLNVAFVPQLGHNLLSLQRFTAGHHTYFGTKNGVELQFKSGRTLQARKFGRTNVLRGYRMTRNDKAF